MTYKNFFQVILGILFFIVTNFERVNAGVLPVTSNHSPSKVEKQSHSFIRKIKHKIVNKLKINSKRIFKNYRKTLLENWFGKLIAILFFFIPGVIGHGISFIMLLSTLSKTAENQYFVGVLISVVTTIWCLLGCLMVGKDSREKYAIIFIAVPAFIILVIACIQLFSIIFGGSAANFVYGLLSLALAGLVMLFARILGFN